MNVLGIILLFLFLLLVVLGIEFVIKLKKCEGKLIEDVIKTLMVRLNIMTVITIAMVIVFIVKVILKI